MQPVQKTITIHFINHPTKNTYDKIYEESDRIYYIPSTGISNKTKESHKVVDGQIIDWKRCAKFVGFNASVSYVEVDNDLIFYNEVDAKRNIKRYLTYAHDLGEFSFYVANESLSSGKKPIPIQKMNKEHIKPGKSYYLHLDTKDSAWRNRKKVQNQNQYTPVKPKYVYTKEQLLSMNNFSAVQIDVN